MGQINGYELFYELFLSLELWGYFGPLGLVLIGYVLAKKDVFLCIVWFVVECLFVAQYFMLIDATPSYWWHIFILLFGGLMTCVYPLVDR